MRVFNLYITDDKDGIYINCETIGFTENELDKEKNERRNWMPKIIDLMISQFACNDKNLVLARLQRTVTFTSSASVTYLGKEFSCSFSNSQYRLPTEKRTALDFLAAIEMYIENMGFEHVLVSDCFFKDKIIDKESPLSFEEYVKDSINIYSTSVSQLIAEKIVVLNSQSESYLETLDAIKKILDYSRVNKKWFADCLSVKQRFMIVYLSSLNTLTAEQEEKTTKVQAVFQALQTLLARNKDEFTHLVENLSLDAKKDLYRQCIGQPAHDGGFYHWTYTEWQFIQDANFTIRPDGRMSIVVADNTSYQKIYAPGRYNEKKYIPEFTFLAKKINFKFEPNCDLNKEIIFSPQCSFELIAKGFHFNKEYVRALIKTKHALRFFGNSKGDEEAQQSDVELYSKLRSLPIYLTAQIMGYKFSEVKEALGMADMVQILQYTFAHAQMRAERKSSNQEPVATVPRLN